MRLLAHSEIRHTLLALDFFFWSASDVLDDNKVSIFRRPSGDRYFQCSFCSESDSQWTLLDFSPPHSASENNTAADEVTLCTLSDINWYIHAYLIFLARNCTVVINFKKWKGHSSLSWLKWIYAFFNKKKSIMVHTQLVPGKDLTFNFASLRGGYDTQFLIWWIKQVY